MGVDHIGLVANSKQIIGHCVATYIEYKRMINICDLHSILPISEVFSWEDLPKGYHKLEHGKPHFRVAVKVGEWARKNGFHKEKF
jgi:D-arabinose 1-dehydrogenase-like Zn-dependent alcohol dehydrogenase